MAAVMSHGRQPAHFSILFPVFRSAHALSLMAFLLSVSFLYALSPISRRHSRNMISLLLYPNIFRG